MIAYWKNLTRDQLAETDKEKSLVILPVSAIEQHGPHLPVGTDTIILEKLLDRFSERDRFKDGNVLIAPQICIGKSNEHMDYSGTLTLTSRTMYAVLTDICTSISRHGFKKILLMNSHGGNTDMLNLISRDLRIDLNIEIYVFDWWFTTFWNDIMKDHKDSKSKYGVFHACELETSLMMKLAPQYVETDKIDDDVPDAMFDEYHEISLYGPITFGWKTEDVSGNGVIGEPSCASPEKGGIYADYAIEKLTKMVCEILRFHYVK